MNEKHARMKLIFQLWQSQVRSKMEEKTCHALSDKIHRLSTYNEYWQLWQQSLKARRRLKSMRKRAKAIYLFTTLRKSFQTWSEQYQEVRNCRWKNEQVKILHQSKLMEFSFSTWRYYSKDFHLEASKTSLLRRIRRNLVYWKTIMVWKSIVVLRREREVLENKALNLRRVEIFNAWHREFNQNKYKKRRMSEFMQGKHFNLCKTSFERWKNYLIIQSLENVKIRNLSLLNRKIVLRRYYHAWCGWAKNKESKRQILGEKQREVNIIFVRHLFEVNV